MNYNEWLETVFPEIKGDVLWGLETYRLALFVGDIAWHDVCKLSGDHRMLKLSDQLYSAVGSVSANLAEGYSKASKKDQARFYEYPLGSARESRDWYFKSCHVLGHDIALHRIRFFDFDYSPAPQTRSQHTRQENLRRTSGISSIRVGRLACEYPYA